MKNAYSFSRIKTSLKENYYFKVPFPVGKEAIDDAVNAFFEFLNEPDEVKHAINFTVKPESRRGDVGYVKKDPSESIYNDSKEYFHYHAAIIDRYPELLRSNPAVKNFSDKALPVWMAAKEKVREILKAFEPDFPGICARFFDLKEPEILLRFLKYNWSRAGKHLAKPHYDAGSCTLAIAESAPGLRVGRSDETLKLVEQHPGEALFMLGKNFPKVTSNEFIPSWHDVIQTDDALIDRPYARWAVVCFFEAEGLVAESRKDNKTVIAAY